MDFLLDLLIQLLSGIFLSLSGVAEPERKIKKWQSTLFKVFAAVISCVTVACIGVGIGFLIAGGNLHIAGIVLFAVGTGLLVLQILLIVIAIAVAIRKFKKRNSETINENVIDID